MKTKEKITRKDTRKHLEQLHLACEICKVITHFFPDLMPMLKHVSDPRNESYITYQRHILLMTRILSSIFYISSMRKTSEELNSSVSIENTGFLCGEPDLPELPYWETINRYLEKLPPDDLQETVYRLCERLIRSHRFDDARVRGKYWQVLVDGTQLESSRKELDPRCLRRTHRDKDGKVLYTEYYYYVLEAKLYLGNGIVVSLGTEFLENEGKEEEKQDCELKACYRMLGKVKKKFRRLPLCITVDSLYAGSPFFRMCEKKGWRYIVRFKEGSIPYIAEEYESLNKREPQEVKGKTAEGEAYTCSHVSGIEYEGSHLQVIKYEEAGKEYPYYYITDLAVTQKNSVKTAENGRCRWKIENEGFNTQKKQGYNVEHMYSRTYEGMKNHYYLIQIGHMISQMLEKYEKLWRKVRQSREQKHRRLLEAWKGERLRENEKELEKKYQIRLEFE